MRYSHRLDSREDDHYLERVQKKKSHFKLLDLACPGLGTLPSLMCLYLTSIRPDIFLSGHVYIPENLNL